MSLLGKRLRDYVLTRVSRTSTFAFTKNDVNGTQISEFTEQAYMRYQRTWNGFEAIFRRGKSGTLSAYCKSEYISYEGMKKWVCAHGLSVRFLLDFRTNSAFPRRCVWPCGHDRRRPGGNRCKW